MGNANSKDAVPETIRKDISTPDQEQGGDRDRDLEFPMPEQAEGRFNTDQLHILVKALYKLPMSIVLKPEQIGVMVGSTELYTVAEHDHPKRVITRGSSETRGLFVLFKGTAKVYDLKQKNTSEAGVEHARRVRKHRRGKSRPSSEASSREMLVQTLQEGDFFGEVSIIFGVPAIAWVDIMPGSEFAVVLREAIPHDILHTAGNPDDQLQRRMWCAHRAYVDLSGEAYLNIHIPPDLHGTLPTSNVFSSLSNIPCFKDIPYDVLVKTAEQLSVYIVKPGKELFKYGMPAACLPILITGSCELRKRNGDVLASFSARVSKPGISLGEMAFWLNETQTMDCIVTAVSQVAFIQKKALSTAMRWVGPGPVQDSVKLHYRFVMQRWMEQKKRQPAGIRDKHTTGFNQDYLEYRLLQLPAFRKLYKADLYELSLSMTVKKYKSGELVLGDDSEIACMIVAGKANYILVDGRREPDVKPGDWLWSKLMEPCSRIMASMDVVVAEFTSAVVMQCLSRALTHVEDTKGSYLPQLVADAILEYEAAAGAPQGDQAAAIRGLPSELPHDAETARPWLTAIRERIREAEARGEDTQVMRHQAQRIEALICDDNVATAAAADGTGGASGQARGSAAPKGGP